MFTPYKYPVNCILVIPYVLWVSWLIPKVLEDGAYSFFIPRSWAVEGLNNLHRNVFCCLFRFLARSFARFFKSSSSFPMVLLSHSRCMILTWSRSFDPLFPTSKHDMWSSLVRRVLHTVVTYIAEPNVDPWRIGTQPNSDLVECQGMERNGFTHGKGIWSFIQLLVWNSLGEWDFLLSFSTLFF